MNRFATEIFIAFGCVIGAVLLAVALNSESQMVALSAICLLVVALYLALFRIFMRRSLIAALLILAPIDVSKALIAPLVTTFYAAGPYFSPGLYISLAHLALLALLIFWLGRRIIVERKLPPLTALDCLAFTYLCFIWIRSISSEQGILAVGSAISYSLAVLAFYVASHSIEDIKDIRVVIFTSALVLAAMFFHVALQTVSQQPWPLPGSKAGAAGAIVDFGGNASAFRPSGFFIHPNVLAHYIVIILPPAFALAMLGPLRLPEKIWWSAVIASMAAGLMLLVTLSRGGWASAIVGCGAVMFFYVRCGLISRRKLGFIIAAVAIGTVILLLVYPNIILRLTAPDNRSLESRVLLTDMALTIIKNNPFLGVGFGGFNRAGFEYAAPLYANISPEYQLGVRQLVVHNHFLLIASELGVPAMLFFVYFLWRLIKQAFPISQWKDPAIFAIAIGLMAAVLAQALFFNSDNYYVDIRIFMFWLAAGFLQALRLHAYRSIASID
ncbi:O-antigen ligase [Variovorax boronicumulans]|uniref:O-antigen ligase family protein n=1 Tax=Variovorax boronicumulans TaxID=436515 RepID=UPI0033949F4D